MTVLDLSRLLPGPVCTLMLADLGADVIKVEDTDGGDYLRWMPPLVGGVSAIFQAVNRNKRSCILNLKAPAGRDAFLELVARADVVVDGFRPGVLDRLGVGYGSLRARNPRVILCSITGYGQDGPHRDRVGHDINYLALAGVLSVTGCAPDRLSIPGVQIGDVGAGALVAALSIMAALHERARTGEGRHCDVSMLDGLVSWMAPVAAAWAAGGEPPRAAALPLTGRHPCYRVYRCADGFISVGALEPKFWSAFVEAIGLPHLAGRGLESGVAADDVASQVQVVLDTRTRRQWSDVLGGGETCCEPVLTVEETLAHPQVRSRGLVMTTLGERDGLQLATPFRLDGERPTLRLPAPGYGEHTRAVLDSAGYDAAAIDSLVAQGATIEAA